MKWGAMGYSAGEMQMIRWRTLGARPRDMALEFGITTAYACTLISRFYRKSGAHGPAALARSAFDNAVDAPLHPETQMTLEVPQPKVSEKRVRLYRLYRAGLDHAATKRRDAKA